MSGIFIHIGPPKTATTSLQNSVIPRLGLPFENRPEWTRALARDAVFRMPARSDRSVIVSDELLGDFGAHPPKEIAGRLASLFAGGAVLFCVRDPVEMFYSVYRQRLVTEIEIQAEMIRTRGLRYEPVTPAQFLAAQWAAFNRTGTGFFAVVDTDEVRAAFEPHFTFKTLDFAHLRENPQAFADSFARACGVERAGNLSRDNLTQPAKLDSALALLPPEAPAGLAERYRMFFEMNLAPAYEEFIAVGPPRKYLAVSKSDLMTGKLG